MLDGQKDTHWRKIVTEFKIQDCLISFMLFVVGLKNGHEPPGSTMGNNNEFMNIDKFCSVFSREKTNSIEIEKTKQ